MNLFAWISAVFNALSGLQQGILEKAMRHPWRAAMCICVAAGIFVWMASPPRVITIASGPAGSFFDRTAHAYAQKLKAQGVEAKIIASEGSVDNLRLLQAGSSQRRVDLAFAHGGLNDFIDSSSDVVSLGSISYEPVWVFYRKDLKTGKGEKLDSLTALKGQRILIGSNGSGSNVLARRILTSAGVASVTLVEDEVSSALGLLNSGKIDAIICMDPPETPLIRALFDHSGLEVMDMAQAEGMRRNMPFLHVMTIPRGTVDLAANKPASDIHVLATTSFVLAKKDVHPALLYLMMSVLDAVHEPPTLLSAENEFPDDKDVDFPISDQTERYLKDGRPFFQSHLPFWMASMVEWVIKFLLPLLAVLVPVFNYVPKLRQWKAQQRISRCYRQLMNLEFKLKENPHLDVEQELSKLNANVEDLLHGKAVPVNDAYVLREHIQLVRRLKREAPAVV